MQVILELFICRRSGSSVNGTGPRVSYLRQRRDITGDRRDPDGIMADMLAEAGLSDRAVWAHSTSWRYEPGQTLLTYLVWIAGTGTDPCPRPWQTLDVNARSRTTGQSPLIPRPETIAETDVLLHGLRHLRYLACDRRDPVAAKAMAETGGTAFLAALTPAPAGRLAAEAAG